MEEVIIDVKRLVKRFPGVIALTDVSFQIRKNTVHCLVGENGAGKSTFIKILTGVYQADEGQLFLNGTVHQPKNIRESRKAGITAIYQELNVVDDLTVEQNLSLGKENHRLGIVQEIPDLDKVADILKELDPRINLNQKVATLSVAQKQVIEIAKAISSDANIIVMDEPTAAISEEEVRRLFEIIGNLKHQGVTIIYISHRLSEIFEIGDYVTVFRDGKMINTLAVQELDHNGRSQASVELVKMMLGKVVAEHYTPNEIDYQTKVLQAQNLTNHTLKNVSFDLHKGEILGFYGLMGSGKTETARVLYGLDPHEGRVMIKGKDTRLGSVRRAIKSGITMIPEERRADGIFGVLSIRENIPIMKMGNVLKNRIISRIKERNLAHSYMQKLRVAARNEEQSVSFLSGGNQQKVVISKCLNSESSIFLMDEPTRGVDVGAKEEIHNIIRELSKEGCSIIVFSTELPEIINLCDRIILMYEGEIRKDLKNHKDIDSEEIMHIITGGQGGIMIKAALKGITQRQEFVLFAILVAIGAVFTIIAPYFLSAYNIGNLLKAVSMIVIVACGGTFLMMTANFDLSTGGNLIFSNIIFAMTCLAGVPVVFALGITILCGCAIGAINGILVTRFSVTPFIATLGTWFIFKGLAKAITGNNEIKAGLPKSFDFLGQAQLGPVPMPVVILVVVVAVFLFLERKTLLGKYSMAIGGNPTAAYLSGINSDRIVFLLFTITGGLAGLAGSIAASRIGSGNPRMGDGFEFDVIIAIILGGTRLAGGRGTILGTLIGALIVAVIGSGLNMLGMLSFWQLVLKGFILVLAILLNEKLRK